MHPIAFAPYLPPSDHDANTDFARTRPELFMILLEFPAIVNNADRTSSNWSPYNHDHGDEDRHA